MNLFAPQASEISTPSSLQILQIPLPASFLTLPEILQLPLVNFSAGIGNPLRAPGRIRKTRGFSTLVHLFSEDTGACIPRFVLNYGLGWS